MPIFVGLLLTLAVPAAAQNIPSLQTFAPRPDAPAFGVRGPYPVGIQDYPLHLEYQDGTVRDSRVTIWYPAQTPGDDAQTFTYPAEQRIVDYGGPLFFPRPGQAFLDAVPAADDAPYPLIIYSHGGWGYRWFQPEYTEHLASYGFVVLATDHEDAAPIGAMPPHAELSRQWDISALIDYAEQITAADGVLAGIVDTERVGVTGYSAGGFTALLAGGARINPQAKVDWCASEQTKVSWIWPLLCTDLDARAQSWSELLGWQTPPSDLWPPVGDARVDAIVSLDGGAHDFGVEGIQAIRVPALLFFARGAPNAIPYDHDRLLAAMDGEKQAIAIIENADHALFMPQCLEGMLMAATVDVCAEPVWDKARAHDLVHHLAAAFFRDVFYDDTAAHAALAPDAADFPGITYQARGF